MSDLPYGIYEGEVVTVSPNNYSALVDLSLATGPENPPVLCGILMQHGGASDASHFVSMPAIGSRVLVISAQSSSIPVIVGYIPASALPSDQTRAKTELDPLSSNINLMDFRGAGPDDLLPGDLSIVSNGARINLESGSGVELGVSSGGEVSVSEAMGISRVTLRSHELHTVNPLYTCKVGATGSGSTQLELSAHTTSNTERNSLSDNDVLHGDLQLIMGSGVPLKLLYTGSSNPAGFEITADGTVRIMGRRVEIDNQGGVTQASSGLPDRFEGDITLRTDSDLIVESTNSYLTSSGNTDITSGNSVSIGSKQVTITSDSKNSLATPGRDFSMQIRALQGGIKIEAGSELPTPSSINKPGVRIQSAGGGDIHLASKLSAGGAFTSGTIVLSSPVPASTAGSGGLGNYGVVINSPLIMAGNYPGFEDTPEGIPSVWPPPVPPAVDSYTKHFQYMLTLTGQLAAASAGLTASFPITAAASVAAYSGIMSPFIAASSLPPVGRPISFVGVN